MGHGVKREGRAEERRERGTVTRESNGGGGRLPRIAGPCKEVLKSSPWRVRIERSQSQEHRVCALGRT